MILAVADLLACPVCGEPLTLDAATFACPSRHAFDVNRAGYVDLVAPVGRKAPDADTGEMVAARESFLAAGHYRPIVDGLLTELRAGAVPPAVIADLGAGPGHYAREVLAALSDARAVACDLSRAAVSRAARVHDRMGAVRANVKTRVPIREGAVDAVLTVFAPRNPGEWARILVPGGIAVVVIPTEQHLRQLRETGAVLDIEPAKRERLLAEVAPHLDHVRETTREWDFAPSADEVATLIGMGPSALHGSRLTRVADAVAAASTVTASVEIHVFARS
jgi:23S rRNA (guanine745-N1)-methyltransferase